MRPTASPLVLIGMGTPSFTELCTHPPFEHEPPLACRDIVSPLPYTTDSREPVTFPAHDLAPSCRRIGYRNTTYARNERRTKPTAMRMKTPNEQ